MALSSEPRSPVHCWIADPDAPDYCPQAAAPNTSLSGTTPLGPIDFKYAYFGLLIGCVDCPYASDGAIAFFGAPNPVDPGSDSLTVTPQYGAALDLSLGGEQVEVSGFDPDSEVVVVFTDLHVPTVAQTNPPLDPDAPPTLSGTLSITGGGWNVSGEFVATLCRTVDVLLTCS